MSSYGRTLRQELERRCPELAGRLPKIYEKAEKILVFTQSKFPHFTPHGLSHGKIVEENLNWLIPDHVKRKMDCWEIFFLIIAAWMHDWGMVAEEGEDQEKVREEHHIRQRSRRRPDRRSGLLRRRCLRQHHLPDLQRPGHHPEHYLQGHRVPPDLATERQHHYHEVSPGNRH